MNKFLSIELYNEVDDLIERLHELREDLIAARDAKNYDDFDEIMDDAYTSAQVMCHDIDAIHNNGTNLYYEEYGEDEDDD